MFVPYASLCPRTQLELKGLEWKAAGTHTLSNGLVSCTQDIICLADKQKIISERRYQPRSQAIMGSLMSWRSCKTDPADIVAVSTTKLEATGDEIKFSSTPRASQVPRLPSSALSVQVIMRDTRKPSGDRNSWGDRGYGVLSLVEYTACNHLFVAVNANKYVTYQTWVSHVITERFPRHRRVSRPPSPTMSLLDDGPVVLDDLMRDRARKFEEFLQSESQLYDYKDSVLNMLRWKQTRLIVNIDDLRDYRREFADGLLKSPTDFLPAFEHALTTLVHQVADPRKHDIEDKTFRVGFSGSFGDHHVSPRTLRASQLNKMISLEGIITRCSLVRPKMTKSVHYCPTTTQFYSQQYRDATTTTNLPPTSVVPPREDTSGNPLEMEYGHSVFQDHQRVSIQEMPERAPPGQLPRSIDVVLDDDMVDRCKPGDRIQLVGIYRSMGGGGSGTFRFGHSILMTSRLTIPP